MDGLSAQEIHHPVPNWVPPVLPTVADDEVNPLKFHCHPEVNSQCKRLIEDISNTVRLHVEALGLVNGSVASLLFQIHMVLNEMFQNAHCHGNGVDPNKRINVNWGILDNELHVSIKDEGPGFDYHKQLQIDPTDTSNLENGNGRGMLLARTWMDAQWKGNGNEVALRKKL